jgi:predicted nucleic acid-binding protein
MLWSYASPSIYEVLRGLLKVNATHKPDIFRSKFVPLFEWAPLTDADWEKAAGYWAEATTHGRQFSDIDLLLAAISTRLNAVIVSSDADFDALAVRRDDWRARRAAQL